MEYPAVSTPSLKRGGAGSTRRTAQRDTFFAPTTAHLFACKTPAKRLLNAYKTLILKYKMQYLFFYFFLFILLNFLLLISPFDYSAETINCNAICLFFFLLCQEQQLR